MLLIYIYEITYQAIHVYIYITPPQSHAPLGPAVGPRPHGGGGGPLRFGRPHPADVRLRFRPRGRPHGGEEECALGNRKNVFHRQHTNSHVYNSSFFLCVVCCSLVSCVVDWLVSWRSMCLHFQCIGACIKLDQKYWTSWRTLDVREVGKE